LAYALQNSQKLIHSNAMSAQAQAGKNDAATTKENDAAPAPQQCF
jgi:hypothetical protein